MPPNSPLPFQPTKLVDDSIPVEGVNPNVYASELKESIVGFELEKGIWAVYVYVITYQDGTKNRYTSDEYLPDCFAPINHNDSSKNVPRPPKLTRCEGFVKFCEALVPLKTIQEAREIRIYLSLVQQRKNPSPKELAAMLRPTQ